MLLDREKGVRIVADLFVVMEKLMFAPIMRLYRLFQWIFLVTFLLLKYSYPMIMLFY